MREDTFGACAVPNFPTTTLAVLKIPMSEVSKLANTSFIRNLRIKIINPSPNAFLIMCIKNAEGCMQDGPDLARELMTLLPPGTIPRLCSGRCPKAFLMLARLEVFTSDGIYLNELRIKYSKFYLFRQLVFFIKYD